MLGPFNLAQLLGRLGHDGKGNDRTNDTNQVIGDTLLNFLSLISLQYHIQS